MSETPQWMDVFDGKQVDEVRAGLDQQEVNKVLMETMIEKVGSFHAHFQKLQKKVSDLQVVVESQEEELKKVKGKNQRLQRRITVLKKDEKETYKIVKNLKRKQVEDRENMHRILRSLRGVKDTLLLPDDEDDILVESDD